MCVLMQPTAEWQDVPNRRVPMLCTAKWRCSDTLAVFEFMRQDCRTCVSPEKHYKLVPPSRMSQEDIMAYRNIAAD